MWPTIRGPPACSTVRRTRNEHRVALSRKLSLAAGPAKDNSDTMKPPPDPHYRHRFPAEVISHAVWLYHVFSLSLRDVELLLAERGIVVSYETVRRWCKKFGQSFANLLRCRRPRPGDKWHLDEAFIQIHGVQHYLWRAVDQNGVVLDVLVQERRDGKAAERFLSRLLKGLHYVPRVVVTDKLRSYGVAKCQLLPNVEHRQSRYLNNRGENSTSSATRRRERIHGHFHPRRHLLTADAYRTIRSIGFDVWHQKTCARPSA